MPEPIADFLDDLECTCDDVVYNSNTIEITNPTIENLCPVCQIAEKYEELLNYVSWLEPFAEQVAFGGIEERRPKWMRKRIRR